jgi:arylsulfatase A-like enzyme
MNILYIMFDQLRFDYLGCSGHQTIKTPNIDRIAAMGVRFSNAYTQSPVCGAARMSAYTGRYVSSHGAQWKATPCVSVNPRWAITCAVLMSAAG